MGKGSTTRISRTQVVMRKCTNEMLNRAGTLIFNNPRVDDQGYYQCHVKNIFGTALSNRVHVRLGSK